MGAGVAVEASVGVKLGGICVPVAVAEGIEVLVKVGAGVSVTVDTMDVGVDEGVGTTVRVMAPHASMLRITGNKIRMRYLRFIL